MCELIRTEQLPRNTVVLLEFSTSHSAGPTPWREILNRRFLVSLSLVAFGAGLVAMMTSLMGALFGANETLQLGLSIPAAFVGMMLTALLIDHFTGRRRLWGKTAGRHRGGKS